MVFSSPSIIGGGGNDTFIISANSTLTGTIDGGGGNDSLIIDSGAVIDSTLTGIGASGGVSGTISINGGSISVDSSDIFTGGSIVSDGGTIFGSIDSVGATISTSGSISVAAIRPPMNNQKIRRETQLTNAEHHVRQSPTHLAQSSNRAPAAPSLQDSFSQKFRVEIDYD